MINLNYFIFFIQCIPICIHGYCFFYIFTGILYRVIFFRVLFLITIQCVRMSLTLKRSYRKKRTITRSLYLGKDGIIQIIKLKRENIWFFHYLILCTIWNYYCFCRFIFVLIVYITNLFQQTILELKKNYRCFS